MGVRPALGVAAAAVLATAVGFWAGPKCGLVEEDGGRAGLLVAVAVTMVLQLIQGYQPGTQRAGTVEALAQENDVISVFTRLDVTGRDVVKNHQAGHIIHGVFDLDLFAGLANDNSHFDFIIELLGNTGDLNRGTGVCESKNFPP